MRVLVVSALIPFPPIGGGKLRTFHLMRALAAEHDVTLVGFTFDEPLEPAPFPVRVIPVRYESPPLYRAMNEGDDAAFTWLDKEANEPWFASYFDCPAMEEELRRLAGEGFDLVVFEGSDMGRFARLFGASTRKVLDFMDVHSRMAERFGSWPEMERTLRFEREIAAQCHPCLACSQEDAGAVADLLGARDVAVIPNGVDTMAFAQSDAEPKPGYVLFTGSMDFEPNIEGVEFFTREILPHIPGATFHVVGARPVDRVTLLAAPNVIIHGFVPSMRPYFEKAAVFVAPILHGGGTRLKILEAAASGKAIVTTSLGVEGLGFRDGEDLVVAAAPREFADAVAALLQDAQEQRRLGAAARAASLKYDWEEVGTRLRKVLAS